MLTHLHQLSMNRMIKVEEVQKQRISIWNLRGNNQRAHHHRNQNLLTKFETFNFTRATLYVLKSSGVCET